MTYQIDTPIPFRDQIKQKTQVILFLKVLLLPPLGRSQGLRRRRMMMMMMMVKRVKSCVRLKWKKMTPWLKRRIGDQT